MQLQLLFFCLCIYGVASIPSQRYETFDDVENEAEIVDAAETLKGSSNLNEKRVPVIRLTIPAGYLGLLGKKNLAERSQVPYDTVPSYLPGLRNLDEKAIPEQVIARMSPRHLKSGL